MSQQWDYKGIIPALTLPLKSDLSIDEQELRRLSHWLTTFKGISALMTNGHTGEVFSLSRQERAEVTRIVADEVKGKLPVISAVAAEGISEAIEQAEEQKTAGATALDIIMDSNESKLGADGNPIYDANGKFLKGPNYWKPEPKIRDLLAS